MLIKQSKILWELPKCDTETQSEQMLMEKMAKKRLAWCRFAINLQSVKNKTKPVPMQWNKMKNVCINKEKTLQLASKKYKRSQRLPSIFL